MYPHERVNVENEAKKRGRVASETKTDEKARRKEITCDKVDDKAGRNNDLN
jgi:hypothetical protein